MDIYVVYSWEPEGSPAFMESAHTTKENAELARLMYIAKEKQRCMEEYGSYIEERCQSYQVRKEPLITSDEELLQFFEMWYHYDGDVHGE